MTFPSVGRLGLTDDFDSMSEDSIDIADTSRLLRGSDRSPEHEYQEETEELNNISADKTADWLAQNEAHSQSLTNEKRGHKSANGEHCDSGIESLANGDMVHDANINIRPHLSSPQQNSQLTSLLHKEQSEESD